MAQAPYASPQTSLPDNVMQQAAHYQLGNFRKAYIPSFSNPLVIAGILVGSIILDIAVLIAIEIAIERISLYLLAIPIIVLIWAINAFKHANWRIYVFSEGYIHTRGSEVDVFRWDQIQAVYVHIVQSRSRSSVKLTFQVRRNDGTLLKYGSAIKEVGELGTIIQESVTRVQLPRVIEAFNGGAQMPFGALNVSRQGLSDGKKIIPWEQIDAIEVHQNKLALRHNGKAQTLSGIKASELPNFNLLISLVNYVVQGRRTQNYR